MERIKYPKNNNLKTISLFSGIGGLDLGFINAGFKIIWANDMDKYCVQTYKSNVGNEIICGDLSEQIDNIPNHDVLIGGFPCQPFSMMGKQRGFLDERGTLFFAIEEIIRKYDSKIIVLENVKNLLSHEGGKTFEKMKDILEKKLNFKLFVDVLNTSDYGIPQNRRRVFVVGFSNKYYPNINFKFPKKINLDKTVRDLLDEKVEKKYFLSNKILTTILSEGTKNYKAKSEIDLEVARPFTATMHKMHRASQDNYLTDILNRNSFSDEGISSIRRLTPNECRKLQGFPSDWKQVVSDTQAYKQFGNAVTVDVAYYIAEEINRSLEEYQNMRVEKEDYSLFINKNKKDLKEYVENFKNTLISYYNVNDFQVDDKENSINEEVIEFLINLGVINSENEIEEFKENIGQSLFKELIFIIKKIGGLNKIKLKNVPKEILKYFDFYRKEQMTLGLNNKKLNIIDLFCGAGGMSLGFVQEGFRPLIANDIEEVCGKTYFFNHLDIPKRNIVIGDIKNEYENFKQMISEEVDVIIGGPPCQSFSMANRQRIIDDPRNELYKYFVKVVEMFNPKIFVMENVKGMLGVAEQVVEDFHNINGIKYNVTYKILNAKEFSVPQNRERLIYIGIREDLGINSQVIFNEILDLQSIQKKFTLKDAIIDLRELKALTIKNATELDTILSGKKIEKKDKRIKLNKEYLDLINNNEEIELVYNHKARYNNDRDIEIYSRMLPGDKSDSPRIADIMPYKNRNDIFKDKYYKLKEDEICKTITAHMKFDCNMYIHPTQARGLTPREAARIQSYSDDYFFMGPYTKTYMQIGNSVPPLLSRVIAKVIKKYLKED